MAIKILSESVINRIAAGEVVDRPASVIKELVENSLDANATIIEVIIENAGRNLITIIDNGDGLSKDDLILSVARHATSKIIDDDITNLNFFGFRGEALSSIASVSRMTISSINSESQDHGWSLTINGGEQNSLEPSAIAKGTKVEVRDLFFATPARLKFLRSEKTELANIVDCVKKIALANPKVSFKLIVNNKETLNYLGKSSDKATFERVIQVLGSSFSDNLLEITCPDLICRVEGYVSLPTLNFASSSNQYFFVNKRPINDKLINMATKIAFQDVLALGRYPAIILNLDVEPFFVDVNVHPSKAEVRFRDYNLVKTNIISAIKNALQPKSRQVSSHFSEQLEKFIVKENTKTFYDDSNKASITYNNYNKPSALSGNYPRAQKYFAPLFNQPEILNNPNQQNNIYQQDSIAEIKHDYPLGNAAGQVHDNYIISQSVDGIVITDQHAAHERIFYEQLKKQIYQKTIVRQRLLIPEIIELPEHLLEQILQNQQIFLEIGISFEKFANNTIKVTEIPELIATSDVKKLLEEIFHHFNDYENYELVEQKINQVLSSYACHHSVRSGKKLSINEMDALLREIEQIDFSAQCNHGRPTYVKLSLKAIEKLFERC